MNSQLASAVYLYTVGNNRVKLSLREIRSGSHFEKMLQQLGKDEFEARRPIIRLLRRARQRWRGLKQNMALRKKRRGKN